MNVMPWDKFIPQDVQSGPLYFYAGAGLSRAAGLVNWLEMSTLAWWYLKHYEEGEIGACPSKAGEECARFLNRFVTEKDSEAKTILSFESVDDRALGRSALLNMMLRYRAPRTILRKENQSHEVVPDRHAEQRWRFGEEPSAEDLTPHSLIWRAKCHGVLTPNYDMLLEHTFSSAEHGAALRSYRYSAELLRYIMSNPRFVLKLHGDINDIGTMELDPDGAWNPGARFVPNKDTTERNHGLELRGVYRAALKNGHMIYVGLGFKDETIKRLHQNRPDLRFQQVRAALIPAKETREIEDALNPIPFDDVVFYTYRECEPPGQVLCEFLSRIVDVRAHSVEDWDPCPEANDIHEQLFRSLGEKPQRHLKTELWSCKGLPLDNNA